MGCMCCSWGMVVVVGPYMSSRGCMFHQRALSVVRGCYVSSTGGVRCQWAVCCQWAVLSKQDMMCYMLLMGYLSSEVVGGDRCWFILSIRVQQYQ
jgi:hypothetical protein